MKGVKKCFGVLLALFIIFGLSLNAFVEDTNAYSHGNNSMAWIDGTGTYHTINAYGVTNIQLTSNFYYQIRGFSVGYEKSFDPGYIAQLCFIYRSETSQLIIGNMFSNDGTKYDVIDHKIYTQSGAFNAGSTQTVINRTPVTVNDCYNIKFYQSTNNITLVGGALNQTSTTSVDIYGQINTNAYLESDPAASAITEQNQKDESDRNDLESQQSDSQSDANDSKQQAESTGGTLLTAFSAFVSALTNASPSNCNIDMDLGHLDLGIVNLCELSPPVGFQAIASIFLILFCVPLSIATARKLINLFRSFT